MAHVPAVHRHRRVRRVRPGAVRDLPGDEVTARVMRSGSEQLIADRSARPRARCAVGRAPPRGRLVAQLWAAALGAALCSPTGALEVLSWRLGERRSRHRARRGAGRHGPAPVAVRRACLRRRRACSRAAGIRHGRAAFLARLHGRYEAAPPTSDGCRPRLRHRRARAHEAQARSSGLVVLAGARRAVPHPRRHQAGVRGRQRVRAASRSSSCPTIGPFDLSITKAVIYLWLATVVIVVFAARHLAQLQAPARPFPGRHGAALRARPRRHRRLR